MKRYTVRQEAFSAVQQFTKAMSTVRTNYTKPGQADAIIERLFADKFGTDIDLSVILSELEKGRYDVIVGRMRQAERAKANAKRESETLKKTLIDEATALYCGTALQAA